MADERPGRGPIFLSYARDDRDTAVALAGILNAQGWKVWFDSHIQPGDRFEEEIQDNLQRASCVVVLWTAKSTNSRWVRAEARVGLDRGVLVPLLLEEVVLPLDLRELDVAKMPGWVGAPDHPELARVFRKISRLMGEGQPTGPAPAPSRDPEPVGLPSRVALEVLQREVAVGGLGRRIAALPYPFLRPLGAPGSRDWSEELRRISLLAHEAFGSGPSLGSIADLARWQVASPDSWLVCDHGGRIGGFVHVEPLAGSKARLILSGRAHEGDIGLADILPPRDLGSEDFIHIGSIVSSSSLNQRVRCRIAVRLVAGAMDRVLDLCTPDRAVHRIVAVDYPDRDGGLHGVALLRRYGFEHQSTWVTSELPPRDVYVLDLKKAFSPALGRLMNAVLDRRGRVLL
jgi:hypothetical protein